jgi:hypothetical protein
MKIKSVTLFWKNTEDCSELNYEVGKKGVTEIEPILYSPAEFCNVTFYRIYEGDTVIADMHDYSLVQYFK